MDDGRDPATDGRDDDFDARRHAGWYVTPVILAVLWAAVCIAGSAGYAHQVTVEEHWRGVVAVSGALYAAVVGGAAIVWAMCPFSLGAMTLHRAGGRTRLVDPADRAARHAAAAAGRPWPRHFSPVASMQFVALIAFIVVSIIVSVRIASVMPPPLTPLQQGAAYANKKCPMMVNANARMDSVTVRGDDEIVYHYTMIDIDEANLIASKEQIKADTAEKLRQSKDLTFMAGHRMTFTYFNVAGKLLIEFTITL